MVLKRASNGGWVRKISKNTARRMLMLSHYRFKLRLIEKARQYGKVLTIVNEAFTSKTCSCCGAQNHKLGGSKVFVCPNCKTTFDRDVNAAKNILLRNVCVSSPTSI